LPLVLVLAAAPWVYGDQKGDETAVLQEDFQKPKLGDLPQGWAGSANVGVRRDGDISWLQTTAAGWHRTWSPALEVWGDFQLECQFTLPNGSTMRLALESEGTRDMVVALNRFQHTVSLTGAEGRRWPAAKDKVSRMVLKREGDVYSLSIDDTELIRHRVDRTERFVRLAIDLNDTDTRIQDVIVRVAKPAARGATSASGNAVFTTNFAEASDGDLPKGWTGPTALGVSKDGNLGWLRSSKSGTHAAKCALGNVTGDFQLDAHIYLPSGSTMSLNLENEGGKPVTTTLNQFHHQASLTDADPVRLPASQVIRHVALRRVGTVYTLAVDGQELIVHRLEEAAPIQGVELVLNDTSTLVYDVSVRRLGAAASTQP
jgi:hypothetical protein